MSDPKMPEPVAYLYHDADKPENAHPLFHSTMLVMPFGRREGGRNETPLITTTTAQAYAEALAAQRVAQERERWRELADHLRQFLAIWIADGSLQTFEHREKFRAEARSILGPNAEFSGRRSAGTKC